VIALMLAQRTNNAVLIDAIEIAKDDAGQAVENVSMSPWSEKIRVFQTSMVDFHSGRRYDLIVSNPPFFINSSAPPSAERKRARHTDELSHNDLIAVVTSLLNPGGCFAVILPTTEGTAFGKAAGEAGLFCSRKTAFYARPGKPQERWLLEFAFEPGVRPIETSLTLYESGDLWSTNYKELVGSFYLER
jgi:tRNA1Val (adenine37-N6)-methyltransferase